MTTAFDPIQFLPAQIQLFDSLPSTNEHLKNEASAPEGSVVWALQQTHGKGQQANQWLSESGKNITLSILLKPNHLLASEAFRLSKAISLAVQSTVSHFVNSPVQIKWPNDIYIHSQKVAGILIENTIQGDRLKYSVVGIGLNVNQTIFLSDNNPTSLSKVTGESYVLKEVVDVLLTFISARYLQLQLKSYKKIEVDYFQQLFNVATEQTFVIHDEINHCVINDVLPNGSIVLKIKEENKTYFYGDAKWKI
ncbi:MAG: biotin--[acetyl-CoA-carboxylase] ligase [Bacteroidetes bacterium]|nr:biotin--[acetyl-CoA-carboxylase] ligase [Bacteroidota bacterium]